MPLRPAGSALLALALAGCAATTPPAPPPISPSAAASYRDATAPVESRIDDLIGRMTVAEKIGQLTQITATGTDESVYERQMRDGSVGSYLNVSFSWVTVDTSGVYQLDPNGTLAEGARRTNRLQRIAVEQSRLGIPALFAHDVIHGLRTIFPVPLGMASSWRPEATERAARIAAVESVAIGIRWVFAPMVDVARDPRWGRIVEGAGEDTYLGSVMAAAAVRGFQGADLADSTAVLATAKHYLAYGAAEGGRDYQTADVSMQTLREIYLPPFQAALSAGAGSVMVAFNEISGVPATSNPTTVRDILRGELGFDGIVVSDWGSIGETIVHGTAVNPADAAERAIKVGVDVDMESNAYARSLPTLVASGRVSMGEIDRAVRNVLRAKFRLGLFEHPYSDEARASRVLLSDAHVAAAREIAGQSLILLQNQPVAGKPLLPLAKTGGPIAVIGSLADDPKAQLGPWSAAGATGDAVTILTGIRQAVGAGRAVRYARGASPDTTDERGIAAAFAAARGAAVAVVVVGETAEMSGEAHSRSSLDLPGSQSALVRAVQATGTPVVLVLMNGRPLATAWESAHIPAMVEAWFPGTMGGPAVADVLFGERNPSGKLPVTVPRSVGQVPLFYNHKRSGRPWQRGYIDIDNTPLYPFGHGLSYTTFAYSSFAIADTSIAIGDSVRVSVELTNTGERVGTETVQLYLSDLVAGITRPVRSLAAGVPARLRCPAHPDLSRERRRPRLRYCGGG